MESRSRDGRQGEVMALLPIYGRFIGDFATHLVAVDTEDSMGEVAAKIASHSIGRRLPSDDARGWEALVDGRVIAPDVRLAQLALRPLQWIDVRWKL
jgi:toluene monooxygenase system protein B